MKSIKQIEIANKTGLSKGFISRILSEQDDSKPSYKSAKKLAAATNTDPILWLEADAVNIKAALNSKHTNTQNNMRGQNGQKRD